MIVSPFEQFTIVLLRVRNIQAEHHSGTAVNYIYSRRIFASAGQGLFLDVLLTTPWEVFARGKDKKTIRYIHIPQQRSTEPYATKPLRTLQHTR